MSNFQFLKKNNADLFDIITDAENLFRDEYFEQSIVQIRRFAENLCRDLLKDKVLPEDTFDSMICKIKDNAFDNIRMTEFADDLYFLKKQGNTSAHSSSSSKDGKIALECLERAFEIAIFYSNVKYGYNKKLDNAVYSEELLMTGKKTSSNVLKEIYSEELKKNREVALKNKKSKPKKSKPKVSDSPKISSNKSKNIRGQKNEALHAVLFFVIFISIIVLCHMYLKPHL